MGCSKMTHRFTLLMCNGEQSRPYKYITAAMVAAVNDVRYANGGIIDSDIKTLFSGNEIEVCLAHHVCTIICEKDARHMMTFYKKGNSKRRSGSLYLFGAGGTDYGTDYDKD